MLSPQRRNQILQHIQNDLTGAYVKGRALLYSTLVRIDMTGININNLPTPLHLEHEWTRAELSAWLHENPTEQLRDDTLRRRLTDLCRLNFVLYNPAMVCRIDGRVKGGYRLNPDPPPLESLRGPVPGPPGPIVVMRRMHEVLTLLRDDVEKRNVNASVILNTINWALNAMQEVDGFTPSGPQDADIED